MPITGRVRNATISSSTPQFTAPPTEHDMDEKHESFYQRGYEQLANGEVEAAISEFMKALQIKPRHLDSHFNLGVAHINLKNWEQAAECFKNVISICDVYTDAYLNLGTVYMLMDPPDTKRALYNLKKAVVSKPQDGELSYNLGVLLESSKIEEFVCQNHCADGRQSTILTKHRNVTKWLSAME